MCLAVPVRILKVDKSGKAMAEKDGVNLEVSAALFPEIQAGDYALVHAGFVIQKLDEREALERIEMIDELYRTGEP